MSKYADEFCEKYIDTPNLRRHTIALKTSKKIQREQRLADMNLTKILRKKK